ncbi:MAG: NifU family protein [Anaerolineae bacterium]|nr:NifU family protein [Anaerolineae bacterium]
MVDLSPEAAKIPHDASDYDRLTALIGTVSAYIEYYHGGSVKLTGFDGKVATVELGGACLGCPLSPGTLEGWVKGTIKPFFPDIEIVAQQPE